MIIGFKAPPAGCPSADRFLFRPRGRPGRVSPLDSTDCWMLAATCLVHTSIWGVKRCGGH